MLNEIEAEVVEKNEEKYIADRCIILLKRWNEFAYISHIYSNIREYKNYY